MAATVSFEFEIELTGEAVPYRPATPPSYSSGGDPPEGGYVEDLSITGLGLIRSKPVADRKHAQDHWTTTGLLAGVDINSPDVERLLANLLDLVRDDAETAIMDDAGRRAA